MNRQPIAAVAALALAGAAFANPNEARVRVIHASPDAPPVDVRVDGATAFGGVAFGDVTDYAPLPPTTVNVTVVPEGDEGPEVIDADLTLAARTDYTVLAVDVLDSIAPLVLVDDNTTLPDMARVRFVHASPDAPAVDIAVAGGPVLFPEVEFTEVGDYLDVAPGTYDLEARLAGTMTVVLSVPGVALDADRVYTIVAAGFALGGDPALQAIPSVDASAAARVRILHASPDAPPVDVRVNDAKEPAVSMLEYRAITPYLSLPWGSSNVKVSPANEAEPVVIDADLALDPRFDYTVAAVNTLDAIEPLPLVDDNTLSVDMARVRFVHASPDAPAVDIALADGGPVLFADVEFKEADGYLEVAPGTYDLEARLAGTDTVVLSVPGVPLDAGNTYSVFAVGFAFSTPELEALLLVDNTCGIADANCDNRVDMMDLLSVIEQFGCETDCAADLNGDGRVDFADLLLVLSEWGESA